MWKMGFALPLWGFGCPCCSRPAALSRGLPDLQAAQRSADLVLTTAWSVQCVCARSQWQTGCVSQDSLINRWRPARSLWAPVQGQMFATRVWLFCWPPLTLGANHFCVPLHCVDLPFGLMQLVPEYKQTGIAPHLLCQHKKNVGRREGSVNLEMTLHKTFFLA